MAGRASPCREVGQPARDRFVVVSVIRYENHCNGGGFTPGIDRQDELPTLVRVNELLKISSGASITCCVVFPAVLVAMAVLYYLRTRNDDDDGTG